MRKMYSKKQIETMSVGSVKEKFNEIFTEEFSTLKEFESGDIEGETITGISYLYGKWALSGNHIMIVLSGSLETGNSIPDNTLLAKVNLPQSVKDKIVPIALTTVVVSPTLFYANDFNANSKNISLRKTGQGEIEIYNNGGSISFNENRKFRFQCDLVIV